MSTFGVVVAMDLAPDADRDGVERHLGGWSPRRRDLGDTGWTRYTLASAEVEQLDEVHALLVLAGKGCAAVAEDHDEYGALWVVLAARPGLVRTVHRRYVLPADPQDARAVDRAVRVLGHDPRSHDVAGPEAARDAAAMFGVDPGPVVTAEAASATAHRGLGVAGGPFPWWGALGLTWPGPDVGEPPGR